VSPAARARLAVIVTSMGIGGCGYTLANTPDAALAPFTVRAAEARAPDGLVTTAAIAGAESELSRAGLLAARGEGPVLILAVVRVDERSEGIAAGSGANAAPTARGVRLTIVGRATASAPARDSGEVEVSEVFSAGGSAAIGILGRDEAAQRAGRRLGERLVRRVLGDVDPGEP
jgi:hypothetical protein